MADAPAPKNPAVPDEQAELEKLQKQGLAGAGGAALNPSTPPPPASLDPSMMDKLMQMMQGPPGTPPGQLSPLNPFRMLGSSAYKGEGVNPYTGLPMPGGPMAQFQQGPQQLPPAPQAGMPLPQ